MQYVGIMSMQAVTACQLEPQSSSAQMMLLLAEVCVVLTVHGSVFGEGEQPQPMHTQPLQCMQFSDQTLLY